MPIPIEAGEDVGAGRCLRACRATSGEANGAPTRELSERRLASRAERGGASTDKADKGRKFPPSCDGHHSGASQGELIHTQNQARTRRED